MAKPTDQLLNDIEPVFWNVDKSPYDRVMGLIALHHSNKPYIESRKLLANRYGSLCEGLELTSLAAWGYNSSSALFFKDKNVDVPLIRNTLESVLRAQQSWIASLDNPKPTIVTSEGSWKDKRLAEKLRKLLESGYKEKQGRFHDTYEMCQHAYYMAQGATGAVAVKICVYPNENKVVHELHDTLNMYFDLGERSYDELQTLGEITWMDPERVISMYPDHKDAILGATKLPPREHNMLQAQSKIKKMVPVYEGWRVTIGTIPGRYVCGLEDGTCLSDVEYDYPTPPFAWFIPNPHIFSPWGNSITHYLYESVRRDNLILGTIDRSVMKTVKQVTTYETGSLMNPDDLERIDDNQVIELQSGAGHPQFQTPAGYHPSQLELADRHRMDVYDLSGMPESKAGGKAEPGVNSAIGQRNVAAFVNKRYATVQRSYIRFVAVDIAELHIRALREVAKRDRNFSRKWSDGEYFEELNASSLDLPDSKFTLSIEPTSGNKNSPSDRAQTAFDLYQAGYLSQESLAITQETLDVPGEIDHNSRTRKWFEKMAYKYMYASDEETQDPDFYQGPMRWYNLDQLLLLTIDAIQQAQMEKLEDDRIEWFLMFLSDIDAMIKNRAEYMNSLQGPPQSLPASGITRDATSYSAPPKVIGG